MNPLAEVERHSAGLCTCADRPPPTDQELAELGRRELARLRDAGLPVDLNLVETRDLAALGESVGPTRMEQVLDQIVAERRILPPSTGCVGCDMGNARHWPCTNPHGMGDYRVLRGTATAPADETDPGPAPDPSELIGPSLERSERASGVDRGQDDSASRSQPTGLDRNAKKDPIKDYLANVPDPDDGEWSPM
jgi:hypothetical protein